MSPSIDRRALLASSAALAGALAAPGFTLAEAAPAGPPVAPVKPVVETLWGVPVTDPYRWMEQEGPEWKAYALAENDYARKVLEAIPGRDALYDAISHNSGVLVALAGVQVAGDYMFTEVRPPRPRPSSSMCAPGSAAPTGCCSIPTASRRPAAMPRSTGGPPRPDGKPCGVRRVAGRVGSSPSPHILVTETGAAPAGDDRPHARTARQAGPRTAEASSTTACKAACRRTAWTSSSSAHPGTMR